MFYVLSIQGNIEHCLRLYMDGDGSGKHECLSFFLTIMRREFDALLPWSFQQAVTLLLLDQDKQNDIVRNFCPKPTSSSFWRPMADMNIASAENDDFMIKCTIDVKKRFLPGPL